MSSIEAILTASQLRWTGHVTRMSSDKLTKAVFYGELSSGKRLRGGQRLRYKDVLKRHLKATHIPVNTWEPIAHDRQKWRRAIHHIEEKLTEKYQLEHDRRHGLLGASIPTVFCDDCGRGFVAQIGLNYHRRAKPRILPSLNTMDSTGQGVDMSQACVNMPQACVDMPQACVDMSQACVDMSQACVDMPQACVDMPQACVDMPQACADMPQACVDMPQACADMPQACVDMSQACVDMPQACADMSQACVNMPQACVDMPQCSKFT